MILKNGKVLTLDDYRKIWLHAEMCCEICERRWAAVYQEDTVLLECPGCGHLNFVEEG